MTFSRLFFFSFLSYASFFQAMNKLDPEVGKMLLQVQDIRTSFELAVLAENAGMCTFSNWLDMRKDFDEVSCPETLEVCY